MSLFIACLATSRFTGSKLVTSMTPGVSSTMMSTPVAFSKRADVAALAADDPPLHLIGRDVQSC